MFNARLLSVTLFVSFFLTQSIAQQNLEFKLQLLNDTCWGVYVKPVGISPSTSTTAAGGQVTVVMPNGFNWHSLTSHGGHWASNIPVYGPSDLPDRQVISFGLIQAEPNFPIPLNEDEETLLLTFCSSDPCPDSLYLIDCRTAVANGPQSDVCPFCPEYDDSNYPNNSEGNNPGNDLGILDFGASPPQSYNYQGNYALSAWSCHDCDGDGIRNGIEDTNGNGVFDIDADSSDICDPCDPLHIQRATLSALEGYDTVYASENAYLKVEIETNVALPGVERSPYTVIFSNGVTQDTFFNYVSGDSVAVMPNDTETYCLVNVLDAFSCEVGSVDSLVGCPTITVLEQLEFTENPEDVSVCAGQGASFRAFFSALNSTQVELQWEMSEDGGMTWENVPIGTVNGFAGLTTDSLYIDDVAELYDVQFRLKAVANGMDTVWSEAALLSVEGPLSFLEHPQDVVECAGNAVWFLAEVENPSYSPTTYHWQISIDNGAQWTDLSNNAIYGGVSSNSLIITDVTGMDGYQFRLKVGAGTCTEIISNAATLTTEGSIYFSQADDPQDVTVCFNDSFSFTSDASLAQAGTIEYQWQVTTDDGVNWSDIDATTDGGVYSGFNEKTLTGVSAFGLYDRCYRLAFTTTECSEVYSNMACLEVQGEIEIIDQPDDITGCVGTPTVFVIDVVDHSPDYVGSENHIQFLWQESSDNGITWEVLNDGLLIDGGSGISGTNTDTLAIIETPGREGNLFRALVWTEECDTIYSDVASFYMEGPITIGDQPDDVTVCAGELAFFEVEVDNSGAGTLIYQWEVSTSGIIWNDVLNGATGFGGTYSGATTKKLSISDVSSLYNYKYRCKVRTLTCDYEFSQIAQLYVEGPIDFDIQLPTDITICDNRNLEIENSANIPVSSSSTFNIQWQENDGAGWKNISNNEATGGGVTVYDGQYGTETGVYFGVTTEKLDITLAAGLDGYQYRLIAWSSQCADTSGIVTLYTENACEYELCDFDQDGVVNSEDENSPCLKPDLVNLKLQYNSFDESWGVVMTPDEYFEPTDLSEMLSGRVVLVSSNDFVPGQLVSFVGGDWKPGATLLSSPDNPGLRYFTFDLEPNGVLFDVQYGEELKLFKFKNNFGTCPAALYLLEDSPPNLIEESEITGLSTEGFDEETFSLGGVYGHNAWVCELIIGDGSGGGLDSLGNEEENEFEFLIHEKQTQPTLTPNPVSDFLTIDFPPKDIEHPIVVRLFGMHGRTLLRSFLAAGQRELRLDMSHLPSGMYFITIEQNGERTAHERVVKN